MFFRNLESKTCPICRAAVDSRTDSWVLAEKPDTGEMLHNTAQYLVSLPDACGGAVRKVEETQQAVTARREAVEHESAELDDSEHT